MKTKLTITIAPNGLEPAGTRELQTETFTETDDHAKLITAIRQAIQTRAGSILPSRGCFVCPITTASGLRDDAGQPIDTAQPWTRGTLFGIAEILGFRYPVAWFARVETVEPFPKNTHFCKECNRIYTDTEAGEVQNSTERYQPCGHHISAFKPINA